MNRTGARRKAGRAQGHSVPRRTGRPRRGASRFGKPCRRRICREGIPAQAARRKAGCAQERSVPRRTGRRAAVGETVPAHRGILFLGEPAGRAGALHVSANCVGGGFVREGIPAQAARRKAGRAQGRFTFRPIASAASLSRGNSRTGCPAKGWPARKSALFLGQPAGARRSARQCPRAGALHVSANRVGGGFVRRGFPHRGAPVPPFRIEARRPAIRDRPARPRDTP